jgi:D-glycero-D-manno-heptose 1,7-bisphosphate phosphatase
VDELELLEGAADAVGLLNRLGILVIVVTNQRGIALGRMSPQDLEQVHSSLRDQLAARGARLDGIYHCPHAIGSCECRKPEIGLFLQAQRDHPEIVFSRSAMVGDSLSDMEAAARIGVHGVLLTDDRQEPPAVSGEEAKQPFMRAASLLDAVQLLLSSRGGSSGGDGGR